MTEMFDVMFDVPLFTVTGILWVHLSGKYNIMYCVSHLVSFCCNEMKSKTQILNTGT